MKKKLLAILFTFFVFTSYAQTEQGTKIIGGTAGFSYSKDKHKVGNVTTDGWRHFEVYLNPNAGYFIIDQLAVGGKIQLSSYTSTLKDGLNLNNGRRENDKQNTLGFLIGPWVRYYYPVGTKSALFGEVSTGFGFSRSKYRDAEDGQVVTITGNKYSLVQLGIGPGYTYFINENIGLEALLQYQVSRSSYKPEGSDIKVRDTSGGLYLNVGLQIYWQ